MVIRRTLGTFKATLHSNHVLVATVVVLWLVTTGYSQDRIVSPCSRNNTSCQHKCNVVNGNDGVLAYKCVCNTGYQLAEDKHNCVLVDEFLLFSNRSDIKGKFLKNVSEESEFSDAILRVSTNYKNVSGLDFDAHENYIYYSFTHSLTDSKNMESVINRIHTNGTGNEIVLTYKGGNISNLAVDWVAKNLYYNDNTDATFNVISIRNMTNRRVLLVKKFIQFLVVHPNKGYIYFYTTFFIHRTCMDGSNMISMNVNVSLNGLAVDFVKDRLYWSVEFYNRIYHSNLEFTDMMFISSNAIQSPRSLVIYRDWLYVYIFKSDKIVKLHKITGDLVNEETDELGYHLPNLKIYSKHEQLINNMHPCSIVTNYSGCQELCFAVPSNISITSSLQALCGCSVGERVDLNGTLCEVDSINVFMSISGGLIKHIPYHYVTTVSLMLVYLFRNY